MTGFIIGIAVLTILSQLPTISGFEPTAGSNKVTQAINLSLNLDRVNLWSLAVAVATAALAILLPRTKLGNFGRLVAIIIPSLLVLLLQLGSVEIVSDVGEIPKGIPVPHLPSFSGFSVDVFTGALAVAVIILVQGAGVSQSVPNPDGGRRSTSRDFFAQGAANLASKFFRGLPVGGSLGTTALTVISGSRSRWAGIFAGLWMALLVIVYPVLVSYVVMPALGVLLIIASLSTIKPREALAIWRTGWPSRLAGVATFLCTLLLPIQAAVGIGVVLSAVLYINESSTDVSVVQLLKQPDGVIKEREAPRHLEDNKVTVLDIYGHLFYAGARTLESLLPDPGRAENPIVVLRLRGRSKLGATLVEVLSNYADRLHQANGRLYLSGLSGTAYGEVVRTRKLHLSGPVRVYEATTSRGQSTNRASDDAQSWLVEKTADGSPNET